jgi:hypothetical protein
MNVRVGCREAGLAPLFGNVDPVECGAFLEGFKNCISSCDDPQIGCSPSNSICSSTKSCCSGLTCVLPSGPGSPGECRKYVQLVLIARTHLHLLLESTMATLPRFDCHAG